MLHLYLTILGQLVETSTRDVLRRSDSLLLVVCVPLNLLIVVMASPKVVGILLSAVTHIVVFLSRSRSLVARHHHFLLLRPAAKRYVVRCFLDSVVSIILIYFWPGLVRSPWLLLMLVGL